MESNELISTIIAAAFMALLIIPLFFWLKESKQELDELRKSHRAKSDTGASKSS